MNSNDDGLSPYLALWLQGECRVSEGNLLAWLRAQRLLPLLMWRAQQQGWDFPSTFVCAAREAQYREQAQQTVAENQLHVFGSLAQSLNIPVVLVKGAAVAQVYPQPWMRPYTDIDLLVSEVHIGDFLAALATLGYVPVEKSVGQRGYHVPPLVPQGVGVKVEVHTALARERERVRFTFEEWYDDLRPWSAAPGLWIPDTTDHALYLIHHAIVHHELMLGLLPIADLYFWTQGWDIYTWQQLACKASTAGLHRVVGLALALMAWAWDIDWPEDICQLFPRPAGDVLKIAQRLVIGEGVQKMPNVWRDLTEHNMRGLLKYLSLVVFGDPGTRRALPWKARARFYLQRPFHLLNHHAPTLWKLLCGDRQTRAAWQAQRRLQAWIQDQ
ncbi:MAG TPA: nucleotidyltransferase family protein [Anaerolineae bacterium]|nr:nucleotidyltransferase family protein [Anaerolineae bacterium]HQK12335.1 nucleotidyltransferase family protein [Anaerolineae bacterium]